MASKTKQDMMDQGREAYTNGKTLETMPYSQKSWQGVAFTAGYEAAKAENKKFEPVFVPRRERVLQKRINALQLRCKRKIEMAKYVDAVRRATRRGGNMRAL